MWTSPSSDQNITSSQHDIVEKLLTWELKIITHSLIMEWPLYRRDQISPAHIVFKLSTFINDLYIFSLICT